MGDKIITNFPRANKRIKQERYVSEAAIAILEQLIGDMKDKKISDFVLLYKTQKDLPAFIEDIAEDPMTRLVFDGMLDLMKRDLLSTIGASAEVPDDK